MQFMTTPKTGDFWYSFNITSIILIAVFCFSIPILHAYNTLAKTVDLFLTETTYTTSTSTLVVVLSNTERTPLNAIAFELLYNPRDITIVNIHPETTLCEEQFIITNSINNASGTALFQCGTTTPFTDETGIVATLTIQKHTFATATIAFATSTQVLAHDGYGTDVTKSHYNAILSAVQ
jgi:hypothetical protein